MPSSSSFRKRLRPQDTVPSSAAATARTQVWWKVSEGTFFQITRATTFTSFAYMILCSPHWCQFFRYFFYGFFHQTIRLCPAVFPNTDQLLLSPSGILRYSRIAWQCWLQFQFHCPYHQGLVTSSEPANVSGSNWWRVYGDWRTTSISEFLASCTLELQMDDCFLDDIFDHRRYNMRQDSGMPPYDRSLHIRFIDCDYQIFVTCRIFWYCPKRWLQSILINKNLLKKMGITVNHLLFPIAEKPTYRW